MFEGKDQMYRCCVHTPDWMCFLLMWKYTIFCFLETKKTIDRLKSVNWNI